MITEKAIAIATSPGRTDQFDSLVRKVEVYTISNIFEDMEAQEDIFCFIAGVIGLPGNIKEEDSGLFLRGALLHFRDSPEKFFAALAVIQALETGDEDFVSMPEFSEFYAYNQPKETLEVLVGLKLQMLPHPETPLHERRSMDSYLNGLPTLDFPMIYDFVDSVDKGCGFRSNRLLGSLARHLYFSDNAKYLTILESKHDVFEIRMLVEGFSEIQKLNISKTTKNKLAKFECIRQVIYFRRDNDPIPRESIELIAECIVSIANTNSEIFEKVLRYFLKYPVRCPDFFTALGLAAATLDEEQIKILVQSIPIYFEQSEDLYIYNRFFESMVENAPDPSSSDIFSGLFIRRQEFLKVSERPTVSEPKYTNLSSFQIKYLVNIPRDSYCQYLDDLTSQLLNIRLKWYSSSTEYEKNLWGIISEMELASLAFSSRQNNSPMSEEKIVFGFIEDSLNRSIAFDLMQHSSYEVVSAIINRIRQNFSLALMPQAP